MIAFRLRPLAGSEPRSLAVNVVRYTPQAVLIANVEEARYRALASEDGRLLVEARYAVRNNQRSFLKVTHAAGSSTVWSAKVGGRPIRPGVAERWRGAAAAREGPRRRGGADVRRRDRRICSAIDAVDRQGHARSSSCRRSICRCRAPASSCIYSPRFRVELQPGAFRVEDDPGPFAEALRSPGAAAAASAPRRFDAERRRSRSGDADCRRSSTASRNEAGGRTVVGSLPVHVTFPQFGPSVFLASELTAESRRARQSSSRSSARRVD